MKRFFLLCGMIALGATGSASAETISMEMVTVGNLGNAPDTHGAGYGSVAYEFQIGKYEVTNGQYAAFLNAAAKTDPYGLYNTKMGNTAFGGISQSGSSGSYSYSVRTGTGYTMADKPVVFVSWYDALRFCNWLHNSQPSDGTGVQSGAYTLTGSAAIPDNAATIARSTDATYWLPSENEWYKVAYYDPLKSGGAGYWDYPTKSDAVPKNTHANSTSGDGDGYWDSGTSGNWTLWADATTGNVANYNKGADWKGQDGNVTTVGTNGGASAYGALDLGGNVQEWNEALISGKRGVRGGSWWDASSTRLLASDRYTESPTFEHDRVGFRVASAIPEPGTLALLAMGLLGLGFYAWRKRRR